MRILVALLFSPSLDIVTIFNLAILMGDTYLIMVFVCISLIINDVGHLHVLVNHLYIYLSITSALCSNLFPFKYDFNTINKHKIFMVKVIKTDT